MSTPARARLSVYLAAERASGERHQYLGGEVFPMGGASQRHNLIVTNLMREISQRLKGKPCETYASDMRVKVSETGLYTYPDVVVACGGSEFDDEHRDTLLNPTLIIEVLAESTEAYDRGKKFEHYRTLASCTDYLLVAQDHRRVEHYTRQPADRWLLTEAGRPEDVIQLASIDCDLPLREIYDRVSFGD